ncbi:hypothetical protein WR25_19858 [Diploscapter pachys]|uniref:Uncharacterized protein n=1 Tax=Diploscapter pachys TaxID=2018661 RepID=A0A2A2LG55_9BILA|nr:hypothetical protein WR25_19858 [Diploscapter pachys]
MLQTSLVAFNALDGFHPIRFLHFPDILQSSIQSCHDPKISFALSLFLRLISLKQSITLFFHCVQRSLKAFAVSVIRGPHLALLTSPRIVVHRRNSENVAFIHDVCSFGPFLSIALILLL